MSIISKRHQIIQFKYVQFIIGYLNHNKVKFKKSIQKISEDNNGYKLKKVEGKNN